MKKIAFLTGVNGQDGSHLSRLLLNKGYTVIGLLRRSSVDTTERIKEILDNKNLIIVEGDICDAHCINHIIQRYKPDEIYNTAAMSHVATSFKQPYATFEIDTIGVLNQLEAIRHYSTHSRFLQCSTSEMYGSSYDTDENGHKYQDENTRFSPNSPYACAKLCSHHLVDLYRRSYNLHLSCAITFNHEGEYRGKEFVTRKITQYVANLKHHLDTQPDEYRKLKLGDIKTYRDFGYAGDYVECFWRLLQQPKGQDLVIATGETHSVQEFLELAFSEVGIKDWKRWVEFDQSLTRSCEVPYLCGKPDRARCILDWKSTVTFPKLVQLMVQHDLEQVYRERK